MSGWEHWATRITAVASAAVLVTAALSGCVPVASGMDSATASRLQATVLVVTQAVADDDAAAAIAALDALELQLKQDTASGAINADRSARIQASIDLVRADLADGQPTPSPTPSEKPGKGNGGGGKNK
ncbi:MAG: hypothetical protein ABI238_03935 [Terrimesophilobacter sp.]